MYEKQTLNMSRADCCCRFFFRRHPARTWLTLQIRSQGNIILAGCKIVQIDQTYSKVEIETTVLPNSAIPSAPA